MALGSVPPGCAHQGNLRSGSAVKAAPKLVVVLVIDQFRADFLSRFKKRFLPAQSNDGTVGGFNYLMEQGAYFPQAEYNVLQAMTAPGHATIVTGAYAYRHGVPLNSWFNSEKGEREYCVQNSDYQLVGAKNTKSAYSGTAPAALMGPTLGDAVKNAGHRSRVVTVAIKNRAAILMGGYRADLAVWLEEKSFRWVTSSYYVKDGKLPGWLAAQNSAIQKRMGEEIRWSADGEGSGLSDDGPKGGFVRRFKFGSFDSIRSPLHADLTVDVALSAVKHYGLGGGDSPDILAVSFSGHDFLGHLLGPNRREMEELTVAEDRTIARFLNGLNKMVPGGLGSIVLAFTGDHGIPPSSSYLKERRVPAGYVDHKEMIAYLNKRLNSQFKNAPSRGWVRYATNFNFYLDHSAVAAAGHDREALERALKAALISRPEFNYVMTRSEHSRGVYPPGLYGEQAVHSYFPGRSGDVVAIPRPFFIKGGTSKASHLSGYTYDRMVPLILAGPTIRPGIYSSRAEIVDLAPTLAWMLGVVPPALTEGRVLSEIFQQ